MVFLAASWMWMNVSGKSTRTHRVLLPQGRVDKPVDRRWHVIQIGLRPRWGRAAGVLVFA